MLADIPIKAPKWLRLKLENTPESEAWKEAMETPFNDRTPQQQVILRDVDDH